jgi:photoactive yellow protein
MLDDLDDCSLDELPFGVVCLDEHMKVLRMNRTEAERSGISRWRAIGRDFFADVASGSANQPLAEQVQSFLSSTTGATSGRITHTFKRRAGEDPTTIELVRGRDPHRIYLCILRQNTRNATQKPIASAPHSISTANKTRTAILGAGAAKM